MTTGYAPEFGQTMGLIYNAITPSGTNTYKGQGSYRFQRKAMVGVPVLLRRPAQRRHQAAHRGQRLHRRHRRSDRQDRTHFFAGFERTERDLSGQRSHHHPVGHGAAARHPRAALPGPRRRRQVRHRQGRPPAERRQPRCRCATSSSIRASPTTSAAASPRSSAAPTSPTASTRRRCSSSRRSGQPAQRAARAVRDARPGPHARRPRRHRPGRERSPTWPTSAAPSAR